jgi:hypothetical protein
MKALQQLGMDTVLKILKNILNLNIFAFKG